MKYTNESIATIVESYDSFKEHLENVLHVAGQYNDIVRIEQPHGDSITVTVEYHRSCGTEQEDIQIPLDWITVEDADELKAKIEAKRVQDRIAAEARNVEARRLEAEKKKVRDLAELNRLKAIYETTQGDTP